jgi:hypothetical protein
MDDSRQGEVASANMVTPFLLHAFSISREGEHFDIYDFRRMRVVSGRHDEL